MQIILAKASPSNNYIKNLNWHVYKKLRAAFKDEIATKLVQSFTMLSPCYLEIERYSTSFLDWDNAYGGLKPIVDCLVSASSRNPDGLGLIGNDDPTHMPLPPLIHQIKSKRIETKTIITIHPSPVGLWQKPKMNLEFSFELPFSSPSNNSIKEMHWFSYKTLRHKISVMLSKQLPSALSPLGLAYIEIDRFSSGQLDWDNAYGGLKPILDCLVEPSIKNPDGLGLIVNDNPQYLPYPPFVQQFKAKKNEGKTKIRLYSLI